MITVFVKKIQNLTENEKHNITKTLSDSALARLDKKRNEDLHLASLCALSILSDEQRADIDYTESGIPFFKNINADISISHSKTYSAVAISDSKEDSVGIDIEDIPDVLLEGSNNEERHENRLPCVKGAVAKRLRDCPTRFLTENEKISLESDTPYIKIWTKKEALFKYLKNDNLSLISLDSTQPELYGAKFITLPIGDNILTACTQKYTLLKIIEK